MLGDDGQWMVAGDGGAGRWRAGGVGRMRLGVTFAADAMARLRMITMA